MSWKKGMKRRRGRPDGTPGYMYMEVDIQNADLPTGRWADTPVELAALCGVSRSHVATTAWRVAHGKQQHGRFVMVKI